MCHVNCEEKKRKTKYFYCRPLPDIAQNVDDNFIVLALTSLLGN